MRYFNLNSTSVMRVSTWLDPPTVRRATIRQTGASRPHAHAQTLCIHDVTKPFVPDLANGTHPVRIVDKQRNKSSLAHCHMTTWVEHKSRRHGPLARYVQLWVAHLPGMSGTFSPPSTSVEAASWRSRIASRHVRHARAVMNAGIANPRWRESVPGILGACANRNFTYLARCPLLSKHVKQK